VFERIHFGDGLAVHCFGACGFLGIPAIGLQFYGSYDHWFSHWRVLRNSKREYANNWAISHFLKSTIIFPKGQIAFVAV
jgi:hypothetical protein